VDGTAFLSAFTDYGFEDSPTDTKVRALQGAVREIERQRPWPFMEQTLDLTYDGTSRFAETPPPRLRAVLRLKDTSTGRRLRYLRIDDFEDVVGTEYTKVGAPLFYYFDASQLAVWPIPPDGTTLKLRLLQRAADLAADSAESAIGIPAQYHEVVLFAAVMRLADMEDDPEIAQRLEGLYRLAMQDMVEDAFKGQYDQPEYIHMTDVDDQYDDDIY
jgi:hypothetical protein